MDYLSSEAQMTGFLSSHGTTFFSAKAGSGKYYRKIVKYYVHKYDGFGIDKTLFEEKVLGKHAGIRFSLPNDLLNYRNGKVMAEAGEYEISLEDFQKHAVADTLNEKHGEQLFVPITWTRKI